MDNMANMMNQLITALSKPKYPTPPVELDSPKKVLLAMTTPRAEEKIFKEDRFKPVPLFQFYLARRDGSMIWGGY